MGNPGTLYPLIGSYLPFARTRALATAANDPRPSIEERYPSRAAYLDRVRTAAANLVGDRLLLADDVEGVVGRAMRHWSHAVGTE